MASPQPTIPILRTKLHRPPVAKDLVHRDALHARLDEGGHQPLTLVSAPAGYGKTTLVSDWLETREGPSAWLSLDETDGHVRIFLSYVVVAVRSVFPDSCAETLVQLEAEELPPLPVLAGCLSNDLDNLEGSLVLVLDDYHRIKEPAVHELLNHLLKHPPGPLQLVVISRRDPPLSLGALRAHNHVTEIRMRDLTFMPAETATFLEQATGQPISSPALANLQASTEGWVTGLRLATLALKHRSDADAFLRGFSGDVRTVQDYLIEEVLAQQLPAAQDCLCQSSILNRFCAPLCNAVCTAQCKEGEPTLCVTSFIQFLEDEGMLCVALDESGEWYRYHHLFQELLQRQLKARLAPDQIRGLHRRAASWFEAKGLLEEAIDHALQGDGPDEAGRLIVRHRNDILNGEQWHRLDHWLNRLPAVSIENDPELLLLQAWRLQNRGRYPEAFSILDRIEEIIGPGPWSPATERLRGGVDALRSWQKYQEGEGVLSLQHVDKALKRLPPNCLSERAAACIFLGGARQMTGDLEGARRAMSELIADPSVPLGTFQARLEMTLCFISWVAADLPACRAATNRLHTLGETFGLAESLAIANYFLGIVSYHENDLSAAETTLLSVVTTRRVSNLEYYIESAFALASVYQARGQADEANETVESVCELLLGAGNATLLQRGRACQAELALGQGRSPDALDWARRFQVEPFEANPRFQEPRLTLARIWTAAGGTADLKRADALLEKMGAFAAKIHSTRLLIEVLALKALVLAAQGEESVARDSLARAIHLAQPSGFIRLFVDLGPGLARLLKRLDLDAEGQRYVEKILAAFPSDEQTKAGAAFDHPLTKRELEVLELLSTELTRKQISERLYISPATVKRHTENIYHKLAVADRHKAVAKAIELTIIPPS